MNRRFYALLFLCSFTFQASANNPDPGGIVTLGVGASRCDSTIKNHTAGQAAYSFGQAPVYNADIGYKFNRFFRASISPQYRLVRVSQLSGVSASSISGLVNLYLDWDNYSIFTPYITAGIGYGSLNLSRRGKVISVDDSKAEINPDYGTAPGLPQYKVPPTTKVSYNYQKFSHNGSAYSYGIGVQVALSYNIGMDLMYRNVKLGKFKLQQIDPTGNPTGVLAKAQSINAHEILLNLYMLLG